MRMNENFFVEGKKLEAIKEKIGTLDSLKFRWDPFKMPNGVYVLNLSGNSKDINELRKYQNAN